MSPENDLIAAAYDNAPYLSMAFEFSAPENLRSIAWLFGIDTPDPATARVLELGCASGGNLIPFAQRHPGAQALGVDLSGAQVEEGNALIARLGLENVRLEQRDLASLDGAIGQFDYILCHGVYSWVPDEVSRAILRICRENLSPEGVALVSYNTYPGWKTREIVRDAMQWHGASRGAPLEQLAHARGMLEFLGAHATKDDLIAEVLSRHGRELARQEDYYLVHEYMERHNHPCYFRDFAAAAREQGLAYLADTQVSSMFTGDLTREAAEALRRVCHEQVMLEQYLDFLRNRQFRKTLLTHVEREPRMQRTLGRERLRELHYIGRFSEPRAVEGAPEKHSFLTHRGARIELAGAVTLAVADALSAAYPNALDGKTLEEEVMRRDVVPRPGAAEEVAGVLGQLIAFNAVEFQRAPWAVVSQKLPARPAMWAPARAWYTHRFVAGTSPGQAWVVAPNHEVVVLDPATRQLIPLLDGRHTHAQLGKALVAAHERGEITLARLNQPEPLTDAAALKQCAREVVAATLESLRQHRLLAA